MVGGPAGVGVSEGIGVCDGVGVIEGVDVGSRVRLGVGVLVIVGVAELDALGSSVGAKSAGRSSPDPNILGHASMTKITLMINSTRITKLASRNCSLFVSWAV